MQLNPVLKKLGFFHDDCLVIIHTDDIGMCHPSFQRYSRVADYQAFSSQALRDYFKQVGIQVIGYRVMRDLIHNGG